MVALVAQNKQILAALCQKHHVKIMYLVGSATDTNFFTPESDIDFLYQINKNDLQPGQFADNFFSLLFSLQELFNRPIDLIPEDRLHNPYFIASLEENKILLYEA
ncbi:MAG: nucleotidyltransferase domain-containing protein [Chitinophagia bacterium]|nr:nucleotidyltransferase domain-containing protein [Chitinophagia bacterium]